MPLNSSNNPDWTTLFGSLDQCDCEDCKSLYSPSAYLVDILKFLNDGPNKNDKTPLQVLLDRRPDIANIELTCKNTNTPVPYVDLVNEILENAIAPLVPQEIPIPIDRNPVSELDSGILPPEVKNGITGIIPPLSEQATVKVGNPGKEWYIVDGARRWIIQYLPEGLGISTGDQTLHKVEIGINAIDELNRGQLPPEVKSDLEKYPFSSLSTFSVYQSSTGWQIDYVLETTVSIVIQDIGFPFGFGRVEISAGRKVLLTFLISLSDAQKMVSELNTGDLTLLSQKLQLSITNPIITTIQTDKWLIIRNEHVTVKFVPSKLIVSSLAYQTSGTPEELNANPEHTNKKAIEKLTQAVYPWSLPLNHWVEEARIYLTHLGVQRYELMEALFKGMPSAALTNNDIVLEHLELSIVEARIIYGATGAPFWGLLDGGNDITDPSDPSAPHVTGEWDSVLSHVSVFIQQSGLRYKELLELLGTYFINPIQRDGTRALSLKSTSDDPKEAATCNLSKLMIIGLDAHGTILSRIHRFVRLSRKLGWTIQELDKAITALKPIDLNGQFLTQLSHIKRLRAKLNVPLVNMLSWWANIDTANYIDYLAERQHEVKSLYELLFLNKAIINTEDSAFELNSTRNELKNPSTNTNHITINSHIPIITAALGIGAEDLSLLLRITQSIPSQEITAAIDGSGVNRTNCKVPMFVLDLGKIAGDNEFYIKFQESDDDTTYEDIPNDSWKGERPPKVIQKGNSDQVIRRRYYGTKKFLRVAVTKVQKKSPSLSMSAQVVLGYDNVSDELNLANLSLLYRISSLAKALNLSIRDLLAVIELSGIDPFTTTEATLHFVEKVGVIRASGFSIHELNYLLRHEFVPSSGVVPSENAIAMTLDEIRRGLQKIAAENVFSEDPGDPNGVTTDPSGELTRKKLSLLDWDTTLIEQVVATLNDAVTYEVLLDPSDMAGIILPNCTGTFEVGLAALPSGFIFPNELNGVVTHEAKLLFAIDSHFDSELDIGQISNELERAFSDHSKTLISTYVITQAQGKSWQIVDNSKIYSIIKEKSVLTIYDETDKKLKASRRLTQPERTLLYKVSSDTNYQVALKAMLDLQDELQGTISYDTHKLRFTGAMTKIRQTRLKNASPADGKYRDAVDALFDAPRRFIRRNMYTFSQDFSTDLDVLPASVKFPNAFKNKVFYDAAAKPKRLHFIGIMTEQQRDALLSLSNDTTYQAAVGKLFAQPGSSMLQPCDPFLTSPDAGTDAAIMFDDPTDPEVRFCLVLKNLLHYLQRTLGELLVVQKMAEALKLEAKTAEELLKKRVNSPTHSTQTSITEFLAPVFAESNLNVNLTAAAFSDQFETFTLLHKISMIVIKFKITPKQLMWLYDYGPGAGWLDLNVLPLDQTSSKSMLFGGWVRLVDLFQLQDQLPLGESVLSDVFSMARDTTITETKLLQKLSDHTGWSLENLQFLAGAQGLGLTFPASYIDERALVRLQACFKLMKKLGASAKQLSDWGKANQTPVEELDNARSIKNAVKAKYDDKQWLTVAKPLRDVLREKQRAALVSYLMAERGVRDANDLYDDFLIDIEMSPCMMTTRLKQAISSVQLFIQRCLMNLEPVSLNSKQAKEWRESRKQFRIWEAGLLVFLHPENWIEPELRDDKSPFFKDLENELLQNDVTMDTAETAFLHYLEKLDTVARLEIVGMYHEQEAEDKEINTSAIDRLHVFGRTFAIPHIYYYRKLEQSVWSAWEKVDLDIEGDHLIPVVWKRRIHLFWAIFTEKTQKQTKAQRGNNDDPVIDLKIKLAWSEYKNGKWSPKKTSEEKKSLSYTKDPSSDVPQDRQDFSFKTRMIGDQLMIQCYGTVVVPEKADVSVVNNLPGEPIVQTGAANVLILFLDSTQKEVPDIRAQAFDNVNGKPINRQGEPNGALSGADGAIYVYAEDFSVSSIVWQLISDYYSIDHVETFALSPGPGYYKAEYWTQNDKSLAKRKWTYIRVFVKTKSAEVESSQTANPSLGKIPDYVKMQYIGDFAFSDYQADLAVHQDSFVISSIYPAKLEPIQGTHIQGMTTVEYQNWTDTLGKSAVLAHTPGESFRLLLPHQGYMPGGFNYPFFFQDEKRVYFVFLVKVPGGGFAGYKLRFSIFYHPRIREFIKSLNRQGVVGLLTIENQLLTDSSFEFHKYSPNSSIVDLDSAPDSIPVEDVDFHYNDSAYSTYNWELFFHIPFLIATRLSKNQRFEEAQKWFHYIFDPTSSESGGTERFWKVKPFYEETTKDILTLEELMNEAEQLQKQVDLWKENPFKPHVVARLRKAAFMKAVVMKYVDNLIAWGDRSYHLGTIEAFNEATQHYILAAQILGKHPEDIPVRAIPETQTFTSLTSRKVELNAFENAMVEIENFIFPSAAPSTPSPGGTTSLGTMALFCISKNDILLGYWDIVADRLFKIRHCMNIEGVVRQLPIFEPKIDPALLVRATAAGVDINSALNDISAGVPRYRFNVMLQKALELCNGIKSLGSTLLSALEKKDAEDLALIRSRQEIKVLETIREVKKKQIEDAKSTLEGLNKAKELANMRYEYYKNIAFMNQGEKAHLDLLSQGLILQTSQAGIDYMGNIMSLIPDIKAGAPPTIGSTFGGTQLGGALKALSSYLGSMISILNTTGSMSATLGGYQRRRDDWKLQEKLAATEMAQIDKQIIAAEIRHSIAEKELENHELQRENAEEIEAYMKDKFTNKELYNWMIGQISSIYFQTYQLGYDVAKRTERAYRYELGLEDSNFIQFGYWDSLKKGLLAGEKLHYDLKRMEVTYLDQNKREYEITKHVSLALLDPVALIKLKETGECFMDLPEALFDLDYPGHYMRRIKSASLTIPCVTGPYTSVNCTLTLLKNSVRRKGTLLNTGQQYSRSETNDNRFTDSIDAIQSIATSSGQNDSGTFELNFHDERYLPFEGAGVISTWRIELPDDMRQFDYDTISDVILHLRYTARDGGAPLKQKAVLELQTALNEFIHSEGERGLARIFSLRHEFPGEWRGFLNLPEDRAQTLTMALNKEHFPRLFKDRTININTIEMFVKIKPEFNRGYNESTFKLALAAGTTAPASGTEPLLWNGLLRTSMVFTNLELGAFTPFTLGAWVNDGHIDPNAIQDIFVVCRYTCGQSS
ncbi:MAG: hypothetical protein C3F06_13815 [Candidatus Methanoperedenaceae archaeon]|nr:MAG: hypothetical protein C3F06_13815 [Candidatus Methanoperedenaceae archaeon]